MGKTFLITGSTDGIGLETAKMLVSAGHAVLLHGRNPAKLEDAVSIASDGTLNPSLWHCQRKINYFARMPNWHFAAIDIPRFFRIDPSGSTATSSI